MKREVSVVSLCAGLGSLSSPAQAQQGSSFELTVLASCGFPIDDPEAALDTLSNTPKGERA
jgi:hypothetical protein